MSADPVPPPGADAACTVVAGSMARVAAAAEAAGLVAVAELALQRRREGARRGLGADECDGWTADEVGALLQMSRGVARARVHLAVDLLENRPATLAALTRGEVCVVRARRISEGLSGVAPEVAAQVERDALREAPHQTPAQLVARLHRLVLRADAEGAGRRTEAAVRERHCSIRILHDGTSLLQVRGRTEVVVAAYERIDRAARGLLGRGVPDGSVTGAASAATGSRATGHDAGRGLDQARADLALGMLVGDPDASSATAGATVNLDVVAPAGTLLGGDAPGELVGYGPVPAELVRELAEEATWRRWVTDDAGTVRARSTRRYRPSAAMVQLLRARDGTCRFPTCRRRATACDIDHVVPWPDGATDVCNLTCLCRHHHRLKHRAGWQVWLDEAGGLHWRTPAGAEHVSGARRLDDVVPAPAVPPAGGGMGTGRAVQQPPSRPDPPDPPPPDPPPPF